MTSNAPRPPDPYGFVGAGLEIYPALRGLANAVGQDEAVASMLAGGDRDRLIVRSDIKTNTRRNAMRLRRFYWSLQARHSGRFSARTLSFYEKSGGPAWFSFPDDPDLTTAAAAFAGLNNVHILNYVPLRRITFRYEGTRGPLIGKIKRQNRFREAAERLAAVNVAAGGNDLSFHVPALRDVCEAKAMFSQEDCAGDCAADIVSPANAAELFARTGSVHAEMHSLSAGGLPQGDEGAWWAETREQSAWIALLMPEYADRLALCIDALARALPPPEEPVFCHGDFVCSQILTTGADWTIVDFDLCHQGNRYRDMGIFLASLTTDVRSFSGMSEQQSEEMLAMAQRAYIGSYCDALGRAIEPALLDWHGACAQIHYLTLMLKKDLYSAAAFAAAMRRLEATCNRFS